MRGPVIGCSWLLKDGVVQWRRVWPLESDLLGSFWAWPDGDSLGKGTGAWNLVGNKCLS